MSSLLFKCGLLLTGSFLIVSCKKSEIEEELDRYNYALEHIDLGCTPREDEPDLMYFTAELNGQEVCYYAFYDGYIASTAQYNSYTTGVDMPLEVNEQGQPINTGDLLDKPTRKIGFGMMNELSHLVEEFRFETKSFPEDLGWVQIADSVLRLGNLKIEENKSGRVEDFLDTLGFNLVLAIPYKKDKASVGYELFMLESRYGDQSGSKLELTKLVRHDESNKVQYDIELEFELNLYHSERLKKRKKFGKLENGHLVMRISVTKE